MHNLMQSCKDLLALFNNTIALLPLFPVGGQQKSAGKLVQKQTSKQRTTEELCALLKC